MWVSQNGVPCFVLLDFKDGSAFKNASTGESIQEDTVKRV
jgi:hypothetical protein